MEEIQESVWRAKSEICLTPPNIIVLLNSMQVNDSASILQSIVVTQYEAGHPHYSRYMY